MYILYQKLLQMEIPSLYEWDEQGSYCWGFAFYAMPILSYT